MASGPSEAFEACRAVMDSYADSLFYLGDRPGKAQLMKMINNVLSVSNLALACETLVLGAKCGLDAATMLSVVNKGTGQSEASLTKIPNQILTGQFNHGAAIQIAAKDLDAFGLVAREQGVSLPLFECVRSVYAAAIKAGSPLDDITTVIKHMEDRAQVKLRDQSQSPRND